MQKRYTEQELREHVKSSYSYSQVLTKLGIVPAGGNYQTLRKYIKIYQIDKSHFTHQGWNKGQKFAPKRPIEDYLSNKQPIQSYQLKKRLINENFFIHKCYNCNQKEWLDGPIPLELHHINGNHEDNSLSNITLLCPNCHSLTDNYRSKNNRLS